MHLTYRNVNDAFHGIVSGIQAAVTKGLAASGQSLIPVAFRPSRNGGTLYIPEPCTITYTNPLERVLFHPGRDANPFFHFIEALWMLQGRNDLETLLWYNKQYHHFSDDGKHVWGAYGHRWRHFFAIDQLDMAIRALADPTTRRVVLSMWSSQDLERVVTDPGCRDVPCNTHIYFQVRSVPIPAGDLVDDNEHGMGAFMKRTLNKQTDDVPTYLDMTVCNRSNDLIWGTLGANYVHFSFLQEYIALACDLLPGHYHQFSVNQHVYLGQPHVDDPQAAKGSKADCVKVGDNWYTPTQSNHWNPDKWLRPGEPAYSWPSPAAHIKGIDDAFDLWLKKNHPLPHPNKRQYFPLYWEHSREIFDAELQHYLEHSAHGPQPNLNHRRFRLEFFQGTAEPLRLAWQYHKRKDYTNAYTWAAAILAPDWRAICLQWLENRNKPSHRLQT